MKKFLNSRIVRTALVLIVAALLISWGVNKYLDLKADLRIAEQNKAALADSLRVTKNKVGDLEYSKQILVAKNAQDLKNLNENLAKTVREFNGKIHEISNLVGEIKSDTTTVTNTTINNYPDGVKGLSWALDTIYDAENSRKLAGESRFKYDSITNSFTALDTKITEDRIRFSLTQGLRTTDDGKIEMFASSKYPGFSATDLNSAILDPKSHPVLKEFTRKKKLGFGVYTGFGATMNLSNSTVTAGPQVGIGLTFDLW